MSPQYKCVSTVKEMTAEVMREKNALVGRLNAMHQRIAEEEDPVTKVRRKVEWAAEKDRSVEALNTIVASLRCALDEEEGMAEMAPADRSTHGSTTVSHEDSDSGNVSSASIAASRPHGDSTHPFTCERSSCVDRDQADFEMSVAANVDPDFSPRSGYFDASQEAGAAEPRQRGKRFSSALPCELATCPSRKPATWPRRHLPALLDKGNVREPTSTPSTPVSKAAGVMRRFSSEASLLPQQVRKTVRNRAQKFSSSILQKVGWSPVFQESELVWDFSV
jgi:hypothetical protein